MDYKNAGVDIEAGYKSVELMKEHVKKTMRPEVLGGLGGFSGAFSLAKIKEMEDGSISYKIDDQKCKRCTECVNHFNAGCYVRKVLTIKREG